MPSRKEIGKKIKRAREELGLTQTELAERVGYKAPSSIVRIEVGENKMSAQLRKKMANVLNLTVEELTEDDTPVFAVSHFFEGVGGINNPSYKTGKMSFADWWESFIQFTTQATDFESMSTEEQSLLLMFRQLSPVWQQRILQLLDWIIEKEVANDSTVHTSE